MKTFNKILKSLFATGAMAALTGAAFAADVTAPKDASGDFNWSGLYVGGAVGGAFGWSGVNQPGFGNYPTQNFMGIAPSGLIGLNYQAGHTVLGLEGEISYQGGTNTGTFTSLSNGKQITTTVSTDYVGRIRGRLGYTADNVLIFGAGGVSFSDENIGLYGITDNAGPYSLTQGTIGWNLGGGVEFAMTKNWISRIEYIHDQYSSNRYAFFSLAQVGGAKFDDRVAALQENTVRMGIEYKF